MRHEINSQNTKKALSNALKELVNRNKTVGKVTISDIVSVCGVNRNTFYYHFKDINELIRWTIHSEMYSWISSFPAGDGTAIREFTVDYLADNARFLNFAYNYLGFDFFRDSHVDELLPIISRYIDALCAENEWTISESYRKFVSMLYAEYVGHIYMMRFRKIDVYDKDTAVKCLKAIFDYAIPDILSHEAELFNSHE